MKLEGKTSIVTGGGYGIGKEYSLGLANAGYKVVIADINTEASEKTAEEIKKQGKEALALNIDVSNEQDTIYMAKQTMEHFGRIDVLVNNAAKCTILGLGKSWEQLTAEDWDGVMAVNLRGMFFCCKAVLPYMIVAGKGKIINIASSAAYRGLPNALHYVTSKAGVIGFTRALCQEVAKKNINVNALAPGFTLSQGVTTRSEGGGFTPREEFDQVTASRASKKELFPKDMVGTLVFLASENSDMIHGQTIVVDGGNVFI